MKKSVINYLTKFAMFALAVLLVIALFASARLPAQTNSTFQTEEIASIYGSATEEARIHKEFLKNMASDEVKVGAYLSNVKKLDITASTWTADFYVWFVWRNDDINPGYEIVNGNHDFKDQPIIDTIEIEGVNYHWYTYKISATLSGILNFKNYPLDVQTLTLVLEDRALNKSKMKYVILEKECMIDPAVNISGWELKDKFVRIEDHHYSTSFGYFGNDVYSKFIFGIKIARPRFSSILKIMLPLSIILSLALLAFALSPDKFSQRISLGISTVFTSVAFHISLTSSLPQISYLTLVDRIMISAYFILFTSLISTIYITKYYVDKKETELAAAVNGRLATLVISGAVLLIGAQFFF